MGECYLLRSRAASEQQYRERAAVLRASSGTTANPPCLCHIPPCPHPAPPQVRVLVEDIGRSVGELPPEAAAHPKLGRQLEYLGKLVRATVQAMAPAEPAAVH